MTDGYRIARKEAMTMEKLIAEYIKTMKLSSGLDRQLIYNAWDRVSGVGAYTIGKFFRGGTLYITMSSSVARNQLLFRTATLIEDLNRELRSEDLFSGNCENLVKELVLK